MNDFKLLLLGKKIDGEEVIKALQGIYDWHPDSTYAICFLAREFEYGKNKKEQQKALELYMKALSIKESKTWYIHAGNLCKRLGNDDEAKRMHKRAAELSE